MKILGQCAACGHDVGVIPDGENERDHVVRLCACTDHLCYVKWTTGEGQLAVMYQNFRIRKVE